LSEAKSGSTNKNRDAVPDVASLHPGNALDSPLLPIVHVIEIAFSLRAFLAQHDRATARRCTRRSGNFDFMAASRTDKAQAFHLAVISLHICVIDVDVDAHHKSSVQQA
jgi:hypothetical protein